MKIKKLGLLISMISSLTLLSGMVNAQEVKSQNNSKTQLNSSPTSQSKNPTGYSPK